MRLLQNLPIKRKLTIISMITSGVALVLTCAAFISYEQFTFRRDMARDLEITAQILGFNSASALSFNDEDSAAQTLKGLSAQPAVIRGCVYDNAGRVFATYHRDAQTNRPWPAAREPMSVSGADSLELFHTIQFAGEVSGTIYLESDLDELYARWLRYIAIAVVVLLAALLITWFIASRLQRVISDPITHLADIAGIVGAQKNYSVRAIKHGDDEIGRLIDGFNDMLAQIQARDAELHAAHQNLEARVEERTLSLEQARREVTREKERFQFIFDFVPVGISLQSLKRGEWIEGMFNEAHLRICGLTREHALDPDIFRKISHPDDYKRQLELVAQLDRGEIDRFSMEKRYLAPEGRVVWVVFTAQRKDYLDGRRENLCTVVDITDLKQAQETAIREHTRFKFIFDSLPVGIAWMTSGRSETRIVNMALSRITGVPIEQCQDLARYDEVTHPDDLVIQKQLHEKFQRREIDQYSLEKRYLHPDGSWSWASLSVRLLEDSKSGETQELTTLVDITERKRAAAELEEIHRRLLDTSRQAGMAEVATGVLHNVGNVLNSVNVSATLVADQVRRSKAPNVGKVCDLLHQHRADIGRYLTEDPKGRIIPDYLTTLAQGLAKEQASIVEELDSLRKNIDHIKDIVAMQQNYAKTSGVVETVSIPDLIEDALRMNAGSLARHDVDIVREYHVRPVVTLEKNKALQILVNLVRNAKYACDESGRTDKMLTIRTTSDARGVRIAVIDNGVGIPPENLARIFAHGFTTRKHGHGFGLHSGALAAKELGGALGVHSDGPGTGATFTLDLPFKPEAPSQ